MSHFDWSLSFLWEGSALSIYSRPRADLFRLQLHLTLVYLRLCTSSLAKGSASASITLSLFSLVAAYRAVIRCEEATHSLDCRAAPQAVSKFKFLIIGFINWCTVDPYVF